MINLLSPDFIATIYVPILISIASLFLIHKFSKASLFFTLAILCSVIFAVQYLDSSYLSSIQFKDFVSFYYFCFISWLFCYYVYPPRVAVVRWLFLFLLFFSLLIPILLLSASAKLAMFVASICTAIGSYWAYSLVTKKNMELSLLPFVLASFIAFTAVLQANKYADMSDEVLWLLLVAAVIPSQAMLIRGIGCLDFTINKYYYIRTFTMFFFQLVALGISAQSYFDR